MDSIDNDLDTSQQLYSRSRGPITYAHTWVPVSGMIVKRTLSSSSRTHATLPSVDSEAVSSRELVSCACNTEVDFHTGEGLNIPNRGLEPHFGSEGG